MPKENEFDQSFGNISPEEVLVRKRTQRAAKKFIDFVQNGKVLPKEEREKAAIDLLGF